MRCAKYTIIFLCLFGLPAVAQATSFKEIKTLSLKQSFGTTKDWHVTAFQPEGDILPDEDARTGDVSDKLCFWVAGRDRQEKCTFITSTLPNGGMTYHYQTVKKLEIIPAPHLITFIAEFYGNGSGALNQLSFWQYGKATDSFSQAGLVTLTEQGEYQLSDPLLITADARWGKDETHFSPHLFDITVYRYARDSGYVKVFSYLTAKKYPSLNDTDKIDVISHEMPEIKKRSVVLNYR